MNMSFIIIGFVTLAIIAVLYNINNSHTDIGSAMAALIGRGAADKEGFEGLTTEDARRSETEILTTANRGMARRGREYGINNNGGGVPIHGNFTNSTPANPLMNVLVPEIKYAPTRDNAMPTFVRAVESQINENAKSYISTNFDASVRDAVPTNDLGANQGQVPPTQSNDESRDIYNKLFSNLGDSCEFEHSMRNFYATPNTRVDNDQAAFAKFCYGDMRSCKEGDEFACSRNSSRLGQVVGA